MNTTADFVVHAPDESIRLVVEAKSTPNDSATWAAELRRNLVMHGAVPPAPYFLLALPQHFYLWKDAPATEAVLPDYQVAAQAVLPLYLREFSVPLDQLSGAGWEFVVAAWLDDLVGGPLRPDLPTAVRHWLIDFGRSGAPASKSAECISVMGLCGTRQAAWSCRRCSASTYPLADGVTAFIMHAVNHPSSYNVRV